MTATPSTPSLVPMSLYRKPACLLPRHPSSTFKPIRTYRHRHFPSTSQPSLLPTLIPVLSVHYSWLGSYTRSERLPLAWEGHRCTAKRCPPAPWERIRPRKRSSNACGTGRLSHRAAAKEGGGDGRGRELNAPAMGAEAGAHARPRPATPGLTEAKLTKVLLTRKGFPSSSPRRCSSRAFVCVHGWLHARG